MTCANCQSLKYEGHRSGPPHPNKLGFPYCAGYVPTYACGACGNDVERHEPEAPHVCSIGGVVTCAGVQLPGNWPEEGEPPFEGGGGSSGGGGASGSW